MNDRFNATARGLLEELYAAEPSLRAHDAALQKLVHELMASKPDAIPDERFAAELRSTLMAKARAMSSPSHQFFFMKRFLYAVPVLGALALAVIAAVPYLPGSSRQSFRVASSLERVGPDAFGSLVMSPGGGARSQSGGGGMGVGAAPMIAPAPLPPMAGGDSSNAVEGAKITADLTMPVEWTPTIFRYTYDGELAAPEAQVDVYKRLRPGPNSGTFGGTGLGLLELGRIKNPSLQSFTLVENREFGYAVSVNPEDGAISIYENGPAWATLPERTCADEACYNSFRLKEGDVPPDADLIAVADAFLKEYGVDASKYGTPEVRNEWRVQYALAADKTAFWIPDVASVTYPILVDGKPVRDESGFAYGLSVSVNVRHKRAMGLWNLMTQNYQASSYAAETDTARLLDFAKDGGLYGDWYTPEDAKTVEVKLGTPKIELVRHWQYDGRESRELYVPSLIFPVVDAPADHWRQNVIVPLAKELLQRPNVGIPMPVDAMVKPAANAAR